MAGPEPRYRASVRLVALIAFVAFTVIFDAAIIWVVGFTVSWGGGVPLSAGFLFVALLPMIVTACAAHLRRAFLRDRCRQA